MFKSLKTQTKEILTGNLSVSHYIIHELGECSTVIWSEMTKFGMYASPPIGGAGHQFIQRVRKGIDQVLSLPSPSLIVSHRGVYWAICCMLDMYKYEWIIQKFMLIA